LENVQRGVADKSSNELANSLRVVDLSVSSSDFEKEWVALFEAIRTFCEDSVTRGLPSEQLHIEVKHLFGMPPGKTEPKPNLLLKVDMLYRVPTHIRWDSLGDSSKQPSIQKVPYAPGHPLQWAFSVDVFTRMVFAVVERCNQGGRTSVPEVIEKAIGKTWERLDIAGRSVEFLYNQTGSAAVAREAVERIGVHLDDRKNGKNLWNQLAKKVSMVLLLKRNRDLQSLREFSFAHADSNTGTTPTFRGDIWPAPGVSGLLRTPPNDSFFVVGLDKARRRLSWLCHKMPVLRDAVKAGIFERKPVGVLTQKPSKPPQSRQLGEVAT